MTCAFFDFERGFVTLNGRREEARSIKSVLESGGKDFCELNFGEPARRHLDEFLIASKKAAGLTLNGISLVEANSGPLMLYYLRKACKFLSMAAHLLDKIKPDSLILSSLKSDLACALYHESLQRKIPIHVRRPSSRALEAARRGLLSFAWLGREALLSLRAIRSRPPRSHPADVLFVCNVPRQYETIHPVIAYLTGRKKMTVCVASKTPVPDEKRVRNVLYFEWPSLRTPGYWWKLLSKNRKTVSHWKSKIVFPTNGLIRGTMQKWFDAKSRQSLRAALLAKTALEKFQPRIIVVTDGVDYESKIFTLAGKTVEVPSFCLQYGMVGPSSSEWNYFLQDRLGVFDSGCSDQMRKLGVSEGKILITGNPRFDSYRPDPALRERVRKELQIPDSSKLIVFMSFPYTADGTGGIESFYSFEEYDQLMQTVYTIPQGSSDWVLAVKLHPEEESLYHREQTAKQDPNRLRLIENHDAYQMINAADLVITVHSTTGLESIYLNKPLLTINLTGRPDGDDYASSGAAFAVRRREDLVPSIRKLLLDAPTAKHYEIGRKKYAERNPHFLKGNSSERCGEAIVSLINPKVNKMESPTHAVE